VTSAVEVDERHVSSVLSNTVYKSRFRREVTEHDFEVVPDKSNVNKIST
jgi:hypothetical protein